MTDSELLELAAKALGQWPSPVTRDSLPMPIWNPRKDDGDAFRLAVALRMELDIGNDGMSKAWVPGAAQGQACDHGEDPLDATRRAILLAAAQAGKDITS